jgi:hypothetical protein
MSQAGMVSPRLTVHMSTVRTPSFQIRLMVESEHRKLAFTGFIGRTLSKPILENTTVVFGLTSVIF